MKQLKQIMKYVWGVAILVISIIMIVQSFRNDNIYELNMDPSKYASVKRDVFDTYTVERGTFDMTAEWNAVVLDNEDAHEIVKVDKSFETKITISPSRIVCKQEIIAVCGANTITLDYDAICLSIEEDDEAYYIFFYNFEKTSFEAEIENRLLDRNLCMYDFTVRDADRTVSALVDRISLDDSSRRSKVRFALSEGSIIKFPGDRCMIQTVFESKKNVLMAPVEVIIYEGEDKYYVYRDAEGRSELTPINIGDIGEYYVEIIGGIKEGDVLYYPEREISLRTYLENE